MVSVRYLISLVKSYHKNNPKKKQENPNHHDSALIPIHHHSSPACLLPVALKGSLRSAADGWSPTAANLRKGLDLGDGIHLFMIFLVYILESYIFLYILVYILI